MGFKKGHNYVQLSYNEAQSMRVQKAQWTLNQTNHKLYGMWLDIRIKIFHITLRLIPLRKSLVHI